MSQATDGIMVSETTQITSFWLKPSMCTMMEPRVRVRGPHDSTCLWAHRSGRLDSEKMQATGLVCAQN